MLKAEFDGYSENYREQHAASIAFSGFELDYFAQYKAATTKECCDKLGFVPKTIMDFGAGIGNSVKPLATQFPEAVITCVDVSEESLRHCASLGVSNVKMQVYDGMTLPFADGSIDLAFTACVFHHIPGQHHELLLAEIRRCLAPNGMMILFEHNPLNPLTQLAVARCPFDENAVLITSWEMRKRFQRAGFSNIRSRFCIFFPGFLSRLRKIERWLEAIPLGGQYYVVATR